MRGIHRVANVMVHPVIPAKAGIQSAEGGASDTRVNISLS